MIEQVIGKLHLEERKEFRRGPGLLDRFRPGGSGVSSSAPATWSVVESVKKNLQIAPSRGSSIIQIVCDARDPQVAADIANTLAQTFIEQSIQARQRAAQQTRESLSLELELKKTSQIRSRTRSYTAAGGFAGTVA